ncbi:hypothetical protein [Borrelia crocidurae]|uniref:Uncharacterized protein n=1 Tax=Borrelia crocidurae (strain Achema) TaxID=1155096 RepID=I0FE42_BORCA|nr:hypothetical protein [Borrelia crocidurae]AFI31748.1 hypothetical protein Q7M_1040 [Borrelia crocidurae str. Achema]
MQRIYMVAFAFVLLMLCCKQGGGKIDNTGSKRDVSKDRSVRTINSNRIGKTDDSLVGGTTLDNQGGGARLGKGLPGGGVPNNVVDQDVVVVEDKGDGKDEKRKTLEEESYDAFKTSFDRVKALYYYRPEGFNDYMLSDIESEFNFEYSLPFKNNVYAILKGDIKTLHNLQKIVVNSHPDKVLEEYLSKNESHALISKLKDISEHIIHKLINEHWGDFSNYNLSKLAISKDIAGFNFLKNGLDEFCAKWGEMTKLVQDVIDDMAKSKDKNDILQRVGTITSLIPLNSNQQCNTRICTLKNDLNVLRVKLGRKVEQLIREIYLWL